MKETSQHATPVSLTIAGSDSGGGAGIQADLKTFSSLSVFGTSAITCTTAQNPDGVLSVQDLDPTHIQEQIRQVLSYFDVRSIKTGMLFSETIIRAVADVLEGQLHIPIVVDPVMVATSGANLLQEAARQVMMERIFPLAAIITPNLDEAEVLLGQRAVDLRAMIESAQLLVRRFEKPILLKGGHLEGDTITDVLAMPGGNYQTFDSKKVDGVNSHGSGCSLASAIAAEIAKGCDVPLAVEHAHQFLQCSFRNPISLKNTQFLNHFA